MDKTQLSKTYSVGLGIMSGTSLDGIDLAIVRFSERGEFQLLESRSIPYSSYWVDKLGKVQDLSAVDFLLLENEYSRMLVGEISEMLKDSSITIDFIGCHGHTIFHQTEKQLTYQMLNGNILAAELGITTVCDFRRGDVALGGQGAPLVPIGDKLLFGNFDGCLNLGGFANISFEGDGGRIAYDICPANLPLNHFARRAGFDYDDRGGMARKGKVDLVVLEALNNLAYYALPFPKSLGREWVERELLRKVEHLPDSDALATLTAHVAAQIGATLRDFSKEQQILVTGGGVYNDFLIESIQSGVEAELHIPSKDIIDFKEAIIFALLGKLRLEGKPNALKSVTGASHDNSSGAIYFPI